MQSDSGISSCSEVSDRANPMPFHGSKEEEGGRKR